MQSQGPAQVFKSDCRSFLPDRPCRYHKEEGAVCRQCGHYRPFKERILIIKLDALGDVLRTTSILEGLKEKYPQSQIYWITLEAAACLLENIDQIDKVLAVDSPKSAYWVKNLLEIEEFDLVINLDASYKSASIAQVARGKVKKGYGVNPRGGVEPFNAEAQGWWEMGVNDTLKRQNRETYQKIVSDIIGIRPGNILVNLTDRELEYGRAVLHQLGVDARLPTLGITAGSGARWPQKRWIIDKYVQLIDRVYARYGQDANILLLGGPEERAINEQILSRTKSPALDTGTNHAMRNFMGVVACCDTVLTGDTICLHIACGLKKDVVALFGPTSAAEIDLYGRGTKIVPEIECLCCYRGDCDKQKTCMDAIAVDVVYDAVNQFMEKAAKAKGPLKP